MLTFLAVERAVATRRVLPLAAALTVAGATTAVTPGGLMAVAPVLAAAVPLLRGLRARTDLHLAGVLRAARRVAVAASWLRGRRPCCSWPPTRARRRSPRPCGCGGGSVAGCRGTRSSSATRCCSTPGDVQGAIGRRAAVLATLLAVVGLAWILAGRRRSGIAAGPARRLLVTLGLSAVAMMVSPTKWTQHFGALTGLGTAALTLGLVVFGRRALAAVRDPTTARRRQVAGLAAATVVCGLVLAGQNMWPFVSGWYTPTFSTVPPLVGTVPVATIVLVLGGAVVVPLLAWSVWRRSADGGLRGDAARPRRVLPGVPAPPARGRARRRAGVAGARPGAGRGGPRGRLHPRLGRAGHAAGRPVRPAVGVAGRDRPRRRRPPGRPPPTPVPGIVPAPAVPPAIPIDVDAGGTALPGVAVAGTGATSWYTLDSRQRDGVLPVVVTADRPAPAGRRRC